MYSTVVDDALGRIADTIEILVYDGYLESGDGGYRFPSRLLKDWWSARFRDHHTPLENVVPRTISIEDPMSKTSNRQIRKFNPGTFQSDEELMEQFVVRNRELEIALEVLRANIDSPSCQHVLVIAPRGRGKTMLLARAAAEIRANDELARRLLPVRFMEESQEIFNMADFWLEALYHLARESAPHDSELAQELRTTHADLSAHWGDRSLEDRARAAVLGAADRLDRKLVLMVENLHSIARAWMRISAGSCARRYSPNPR